MERSESFKEIFKAIQLFHVKMDKVKKDAKNPFFNSKYASLTNILDAIRLPLQECELEFVQLPTGDFGLTTMLVHVPTGEYLQSTYTMAPSKNDPQGAGSVITYQRRYALTSILCLNIEEDDDANKGTHGSKEPVQQTNGTAVTLPWLNKGTKEFDSAVTKLRAGTTTIEKIKGVMKLSKEVEGLLKKAIEPQTA